MQEKILQYMMKIKSSQKLWEDSKAGPWKFDSVSGSVDCLDNYHLALHIQLTKTKQQCQKM